MAKALYVDGFVLVVPKNKVAAYKKMAEWGKKVWLKHGALDYKECIGNDLIPKSMGGPMPLGFPKMAKARKNETVWFSYVTYKSRSHRDQVNKKVMAEMAKSADQFKDFEMPFDVRRMASGGFKVIVSS